MKMDDMILISVDDHIVEPPDMFKRHTPAKYKDRMPKFVSRPDGSDIWLVEDRVVTNPALNCVAGRRPEEYGFEPASLNDIRRACYDVDARLDDMNANGQLAGLNFPSFPGIAGKVFREGKDKDLMSACTQAWNDWHVLDWCGKHPARFIPLGLVQVWNPTLAGEEVRRLKKMGCSAITFPPNPARAGLPSIHDPFWDPLWKACNDEQVVICMHITDTTGMAPSVDSPYDTWLTCNPISLFTIAADLIFSPVLRKYPDIKFAMSEGGAGWIPTFLDRIDFVYRHHHRWTNQDFGGRLPSEVFLEHVYTCIIDDEVAITMREKAGLANMMWECDYPHSDSIWPRAPEIMWKCFKGVPKADIDKITHLNAMRGFFFDPFKSLKREACTVGALRAQAAHVDVGHVYVHDEGPVIVPPRDGPPKPVVTMVEYMRYVNKDAAAALGGGAKA